jgi:DegV family protein with EDD domain
MKTLISTDTSCLINYEALNKYDINVFALNVIVDGKEYLDGITITQDELRDAMRSNKDIKTSTPPLGDVIEYFEKLFSKGYERIIHFTISSKLSSMYDLFCNVAKQHFEGKLFIIDSYALSTVMLSQVFLAYDMAKQDLPTEQILSSLEQRKLDSYIVFIPENLNALKNGGRISPAVALIGNVLGIKPVIVLKEGALEKESSTKHVRRTFLEEIDQLKDKMPTSQYDYTLVSFDGKAESVNYILAGMGEKLGDENYLQGIVPINVCAHCGPGTIGLMVSKKINGKSIKEYL